MPESTASPGNQAATAAESEAADGPTRILYLGGAHDALIDLRRRLGDDVEVVELSSSVKALAQMARGDYAAVYVDADYFAEVSNVAHLLQNDRILQGMADGVVLVDADSIVLWSNRRFRDWCDETDVIGANFYKALGRPEILGPDYCPFHTALATAEMSASTIRRAENRYYRLHATPVTEGDAPPANLIVTLHDVTDEMIQQQKLAAIHQAGTDLADLMPDDVATLEYSERVELLKSNIVHCMKDVLKLDVIEIRMLDRETGTLDPLLEVGMDQTAADRVLRAEPEGNGVTGFVAATGKSYLCGHTTEDPLYLEGAKDARSSLTVPLILHDEVIGTLNVESPEANAFDESDLQFLEIFARNVAAALNTLELLAAEKASTAAASVEAIHSAVALPVDDILNDAVNVMECYIGHEPDVVERLQRILQNARDIKLVIQKVGQSMSPAQAQLGGLSTESRPLLAGRRILVVDDDESVRTAAHELLERYHCIVETAHNGNEASYMVRNLDPRASYDVIIADIRLPDMNGYELLMKLRQMLDRVPLVLMTGFGYDPGHTIVRARREGVRSVLYKPFRLDQLVNTIEETVRLNQTGGTELA